MRIEDEKLLATFRQARSCGWCQQPLRNAPEVHHVYGRGAGRLDIAVNLIALGGPWDCGCHGLVHSTGEITRFDLLAVVGAREGLMQTEIEDVVYALRRHRKDLPLPEWLRRFVQ